MQLETWIWKGRVCVIFLGRLIFKTKFTFQFSLLIFVSRDLFSLLLPHRPTPPFLLLHEEISGGSSSSPDQ
jgi:hypothetical protein